MTQYLGDWCNNSFVGGRERDYHRSKVLYWDEYVHYVTELDYTPLDNYWYSRTYSRVHSNPAIEFAQEAWT